MSASWFAIARLGQVDGHLVAESGRPWGFCRVWMSYDEGGEEIAVIPQWLAGFLATSRRVRGKNGKPASWAGVAWHRWWKAGQRAGWIKIEAAESASERLARELTESDESQALGFFRNREAQQQRTAADWRRR